MPVVKEREYRALATPLMAANTNKRIDTEYYVEGYATTFNQPYTYGSLRTALNTTK